ncbi:MAG: nucleoside 2-deoxyribosyltransferase [Anaerolineales bacterium]|nr:nucleoside 2-deoxyribosyltransferase [Anaerolineales bacterium]
MDVYFACSITGGRKEENVYQLIVDMLIADGHQVPTAHLSRPDVMELEQVVDPVEVFTRDIRWINNCQAMVAEVSTPSHGVGFEISYALSIQKPVLCLHRDGIHVSKMLTGNSDPILRVLAYQSPDELPLLIRDFLAQI